MKLHHVGITMRFGASSLEKIIWLNSLFDVELQDWYAIEKWNCICYPVGMVEFVVLHAGSPMLKYHEGYREWTKTGAPFVLHHIALEVKDYDKTLEKVKKLGQVVGEDIGYMGKRVAFLHPSMFGILIEIVEGE